MYGLALRITRQSALAADATHDAFLQVWQNAARFDPARGGAVAWLTSLVRYRALDIVRHSGRELSGYEAKDAPDDAPDPLQTLLSTAEGAALLRCLGQLDEGRRNAIVLAFVDGLSHAELATRLGVPLGYGEVLDQARADQLARVPAIMSGTEDGDRDMLAAEFVLGTLEREQAREAERLAHTDPGFARLVADWERRLSPLAGLVADAPPPPELWDRVSASVAASANVVPLAPAAPPPGPSVLRRVWLWQGTTAASLALAAALGALLIVRAPRPRRSRCLSRSTRPAAAPPCWRCAPDRT